MAPAVLAVIALLLGACSSDEVDSGADAGADADGDVDADTDSDADADADADADTDADGDSDADADADADADGDVPVCDEGNPQPPAADSGIVWDPRLSAEGEETLGGHGHDDGRGPIGYCASAASPHWALTEALFQTDEDAESGGNHNIYLEVLDEAGVRIVGAEVLVTNGIETWSVFTEDKPPPEYAANYPMWGGNVYRAQVAGESDSVFNMRIPNNHHVNFLLTFRRVP